MGYIPPSAPGQPEPRWLMWAEVGRLVITLLMAPALALAVVAWGLLRMGG